MVGTRAPPQPKVRSAAWLRLLQYKQAWAVAACRGVGDPMYNFYLFRLPEYLTPAVAWIPFRAANAGNLPGGVVTSWLIARGWTVHRVRRTVMWLAAAGTMAGMAMTFVESLSAGLAVLALTCLFFMTWSVNVMILPSDWFSHRNVGTILGLSGAVNGVGNIIKNIVVGRVLDRAGSYRAVFIGMGLLVPAAQTLLTLIGGRIERIDDETAQ